MGMIFSFFVKNSSVGIQFVKGIIKKYTFYNKSMKSVAKKKDL